MSRRRDAGEPDPGGIGEHLKPKQCGLAAQAKRQLTGASYCDKSKGALRAARPATLAVTALTDHAFGLAVRKGRRDLARRCFEPQSQAIGWHHAGGSGKVGSGHLLTSQARCHARAGEASVSFAAAEREPSCAQTPWACASPTQMAKACASDVATSCAPTAVRHSSAFSWYPASPPGSVHLA
jgi:hypothetical protein